MTKQEVIKEILDSVCNPELGDTHPETGVLMWAAVDTMYGQVTLQLEDDHNYTLTNHLSCINNSGGDYCDSGVRTKIEARFEAELGEIPDDMEEIHDLIKKAINNAGDSVYRPSTIEDVLADRTDILNLTYNTKDRVFGAGYACNCTLTRYDADSGEVVIAGENITDYVLAEEQVRGWSVFESVEEYTEWCSDMHDGKDNQRYLHYGDFSLAYRAAVDLGFIEAPKQRDGMSM